MRWVPVSITWITQTWKCYKFDTISFISEQKVCNLFQKTSSIHLTFTHRIIEVPDILYLLVLRGKYVYIRDWSVTHHIPLRLMRMEGSGIYSQIADDIVFPSVSYLSIPWFHSIEGRHRSMCTSGSLNDTMMLFAESPLYFPLFFMWPWTYPVREWFVD